MRDPSKVNQPAAGNSCSIAETSPRNSTPQLGWEEATALYRIAQEALRNSRKHAPGSLVRVVLAATDQQVRLSIDDDGPGFNIEEISRGGGLGLLSMKERASLVGARLTVRTKPGRGTRISIRLPRTMHREGRA